MKDSIKKLILIAESIDGEKVDELKQVITAIIDKFAFTYNCPSDWRSIGTELYQDFKDNDRVIDSYQLYNHESEE